LRKQTVTGLQLTEKVNMMTTKLLMTAAAASLIALAGCSTNPTNAQIGTATGAVLGGAAGSVLGGGTLGTVGGAAAGALIGNEVGKRQDQGR
jgi:osmotically inducible lipoprotein OsmB